jgi:hypothetical protein
MMNDGRTFAAMYKMIDMNLLAAEQRGIDGILFF